MSAFNKFRDFILGEIELPPPPATELLSISDVRSLPIAGTHPRVMLLPGDKQDLIDKKTSMATLWAKVSDSTGYSAMALKYFIDGDVAAGRQAMQNVYARISTIVDYTKVKEPFEPMYTAAFVYSTCYPLFDDSSDVYNKTKWIYHFKRLAGAGGTPTMNSNNPSKYPATKIGDTLVGHGYSLITTQLWAGLAIYDEDPEMWQGAVDVILNTIQAQLQTFVPSHGNHQYNYSGARGTHELLTYLLFKRIYSGKDYVDPEYAEFVNALIYNTRPDLQLLRMGDTSDESGRYNFLSELYRVAAYGMKNPYALKMLEISEANGDQIRAFTAIEAEAVAFDFMFADPDFTSSPLTDLPMLKFFDQPVGSRILARTNWNIDYNAATPAVIINAVIGNKYYGGHQGRSMFLFWEMYSNGNVSCRRGMYQGMGTDGKDISGFDKNPWWSFYQQGVCVNSLIVRDSTEKRFTLPKFKNGQWVSQEIDVDGAARIPFANDHQPNDLSIVDNPVNGYTYAELIAKNSDGFEVADWSWFYLSGDGTKAYTAEYPTAYNPSAPDSMKSAQVTRVNYLTRSYVGFKTADPDYPVVFHVFDRINAVKSTSKKAFLIQSMNNPTVETVGSQKKITLTNTKTYRGNSYNAKGVIFTLFPDNASHSVKTGFTAYDGGTNYNFGTKEGAADHDATEEGNYRTEITPPASVNNVRFGHVAVATNALKNTSALSATAIDGVNVLGMQCLNTISIHAREKTKLIYFEFSFAGSGSHEVAVCDLKAGDWDYSGTASGSFTVVAGECSHKLSLSPGSYIFTLN